MQAGRLPDGWDSKIPVFPADAKGLATRDSGGKVENAIAERLPWLMGGSADLSPSTKTVIGSEPYFERETAGRNMHFGIREHGMGAILNGMSVSKLRVFGATFMTFSDYMRGVHPAGGDHAPAGHLCVYPRFHRPWRRWTHAPADRASDRLARHSASHRDSSGRRQRSGRGVALRHRLGQGPNRAGAHPPGDSDL